MSWNPFAPPPTPSPQPPFTGLINQAQNAIGQAARANGAGGAGPGAPFSGLINQAQNSIGQAARANGAAPWGIAPPRPGGGAGGGGLPMPALGVAPGSRPPVTFPGVGGPPYPQNNPTQNWGDPNTAEWQAQQNLYSAQGADINANRRLNGMQPQRDAANANLLDARQAALGPQSAYLAEQTRSNQARMAEQQALVAAKANTGDIVGTARAQNERDSNSYKYKLAGVASPIEVTLPPGFTGNLPMGVVGRLQTLAETMATQFADNEKARQFNTEAARIYSAEAGQQVTAAEIAAGRVSLTLDQAEQAAKAAGFDVQDATLSLNEARQAPAPGYKWDDLSGRWVTAAEAQLNDEGRANARSDRTADRTLNRNQQQSQSQGLGALSLGELTTLLADPASGISPDQFRAALRGKYSASTIEALIKHYGQNTGAGNGSFGVQVPTNTTPPPTQQTQPRGSEPRWARW